MMEAPILPGLRWMSVWAHVTTSTCVNSCGPECRYWLCTVVYTRAGVSSWFTIVDDTCPFHASTLRPASWAGPLHIPRWRLIVSVALLPLMGRVWVYVALPSSRMNSSAPLVGRPDWVTRESRGLLLSPRYYLSTYGRPAFSYAGPSAWNSLPEHLRAPDLTLNSFRHLLKTFLFTQMTHAAH